MMNVADVGVQKGVSVLLIPHLVIIITVPVDRKPVRQQYSHPV